MNPPPPPDESVSSATNNRSPEMLDALSSAATSGDDSSPDITRRFITSLILIGLLLFVGFSVFKMLAAKKQQTKTAGAELIPVLVRTLDAKQENVQESITGYGEVRALHQTTVSAEINARTADVDERLEVGVPVRKGHANGNAEKLPVLVTLDTTDYEIASARLKSEIAAQTAEIAKLGVQREGMTRRLKLAREDSDAARREYRRIQKLVPRTLSPSDLDRQHSVVKSREQQVVTIESQLDDNLQAERAAKAALAVRSHDLDSAQRNIDRGKVRAPFEGVVVSRDAQKESWVRVGAPLFTVLDMSTLEAAIAMPASRYRAVSPGSNVSLFDPADTRDPPQALFKGTVTRKDPVIQAGARSFRVYVEIPGTPTTNPLAPGQPIRAVIEGERFDDVYQIPRQAFLAGRLFIAKPSDATEGDADATEGSKVATVEGRRVQIWRSLPGSVLLKDGLKPGEQVILTNLESIDDGTTIRVMSEEASASKASPSKEPGGR